MGSSGDGRQGKHRKCKKSLFSFPVSVHKCHFHCRVYNLGCNLALKCMGKEMEGWTIGRGVQGTEIDGLTHSVTDYN
jgi:hypothetical protein